MLTKQEQENIILKGRIEDYLRSEFERTLPERISRSMEMRPRGAVPMVPVTHFATPTIEALQLYRDGHLYGSISLSQAVVEALARFICERDGGKVTGSFHKNVKKMKHLDEKTKELFMEVRGNSEERNDFHHLNPKIERDREKLSIMAKRNTSHLLKIENEVFRSEIRDGKVVSFKYPQYWDIREGSKAVVHLRVEF